MIKNYRKILVFIILLSVLGARSLFSQNKDNEIPNSLPFSFDAVVFRSGDSSYGRVDVFILLPYQSLSFVKNKEIYAAKYSVNIKIQLKDGKEVENKTFERTIRETDYFVSQGGTGKFDYSQTIFNLPPASYDIEVSVTDVLNKRAGQKSRDVTIVDFSKYQFTLSGIMFVSSIEEKNGKYIITPHVSDNVGDLKDGFFIFFEAYSKTAQPDIDVVYEIRESSGNIKSKSEKIKINLTSGKSQQYIKVKLPPGLNQGNFKIRLIALKPGTGSEWTESDYAAVSERTVKYMKTIGGIVLTDIDKAIKQLRYVADGDEMDFIEKGSNIEEKQMRFDDFWKKLDPTPNTERNEAFEEYFSRIEFANKSYKSYTEGWRTDKGMVFIVYGRPMNIEKSNPYGDNRMYERWTYATNRQFVFVDNNGFGDYRLYSPMTVTDKYKYEK